MIAMAFSIAPVLAYAQQGPGDYDQAHHWHDDNWWYQNHPDWVQAHHHEWFEHHPDWRHGDGDWDDQHRWHSRKWWLEHHRDWVEHHHHDWL
jgi:hypothetical protein